MTDLRSECRFRDNQILCLGMYFPPCDVIRTNKVLNVNHQSLSLCLKQLGGNINRTVMRALVGICILLVYARLQGGVYGVGRDDDQDN